MATTLRIKKIISLALLFLVAISLFGCEPISKYEPYNYPNSLWVCEEPHMEIAVTKDGSYRPTMTVDGEEKCFYIGFRAHQARAHKNAKDSTVIFSGICKFYEDEFTIKIKEDYLWDGAYPVLTFKRVK